MYVAVKGGERAISNAHRLLAERRRGDREVPELSLAQISEQLSLAVDRVMAEGSLYDRELAALAIKQAQGDLIEAVFLMRAYRTTLPRFCSTRPIETARMSVQRRVSACFKDMPGGQILGPTYDYTHRLFDFELANGEDERPAAAGADAVDKPAPSPLREIEPVPRVVDILNREGLIESFAGAADEAHGDLTRQPLEFPAARDVRLQNLARGNEGFVLALGYSTQRGYGNNHPFVGEIRIGDVEIVIEPEELGFPISIGDIRVTECEMVNSFRGSDREAPKFTRGYGLAFGSNERKAMSMSLVDRALRARELGESVTSPAQDEEFVLSHTDSVEATGFVEHLKLPHYVDFQAELQLIRRLQSEHAAQHKEAAE
jgi:alpha-D-ribose 1-methylphosphonate 5-triphosphate synthase subunit PhnI